MDGQSPPEVVRSVQDFVRALRFPLASPREIALFAAGTLTLFLVIWLAAVLTERLRRNRRIDLPAGDPEQHRTDFRVPILHEEIEFLPEGTPWTLPAWIRDLSAGGLTLRIDLTRPPAGLVRIRFPDEPDLGTLQAKVVRSESDRTGRHCDLHCRFWNLTLAQEQRLMRRVVARERQFLHAWR